MVTLEKVFSFGNKKILIFGTGKICNRLVKFFDMDCIIGFLDNDVSKQGKCYEGKHVYAPEVGVKKLNYDIII